MANISDKKLEGLPTLFISHSSSDSATAQLVYDRLKDEGYDRLFLDYHPEDGIPAGRNWERELYQQLKRCSALIFLGSAKSRRSRWCFAELALANSLGKIIFPVAIEKKASHPLLNNVQWTNISQTAEEGYLRLLRGLRDHSIDPRAGFHWDREGKPYPGLDSFQEKHAAVFFGRMEETQALFERINNSLLVAGERFVAVIGPSGSGKSSLVRAGLLPKLQRMNSPILITQPFMPQNAPVEMLARSLAKSFESLKQPTDWPTLHKRLVDKNQGLISIARDLLDATNGGERVVLLVVDQTEELITLCGKDECAEFMQLIHDALINSDVLRVVSTLRSEFLTNALQETALSELMHQPFLLPPIPRSRLASVIAGPASIAGFDFAPGLVERIVEDTGGGDALPLMAYTLQQLYQHVHDDKRSTIEEADYDAVGGVEGALQQRADAIRDDLKRTGFEDEILPALLRLVAIEHGGEATRRRLPLHALNENETKVVRAFVGARLLTTSELNEDVVVYVAHEAMLRAWPPLTNAIEDHIDDLRERSRLERDARDWDAAGQLQEEGYLLRGERLSHALAWEEKNSTALQQLPVLSAYLSASRTFRDRAVAREADLVGNRIINDYEENPERAILVSLAAMEAYGQKSRLQLALSYAIFASARVSRIEVSEWVHVVALSPITGDVVYGNSSGKVALIRRTDTKVIWEQKVGQGHSLDSSVRELAFTAGGKLIVTRCGDGRAAIVLDALTGQVTAELELQDKVVAIGCTDGFIAAAAGEQGNVRIWSTETGFSVVHEAQLPADIVRFSTLGASCAISNDGSRLLTSFNRNGFVTDFSEPQVTTRAQASHSDKLAQMAFSPHNRQVASVGLDGKLKIWRLGAHESILDIDAGGWIFAVAWSTDGKRLITADEGKGLRAWDAKTGERLPFRNMEKSRSRALGILPDQSLVATIQNDARANHYVISCWHPWPQGPRLSTYLFSAFSNARFSGNDAFLVTSSKSDDGLIVRDAATGEKISDRKQDRRSIIFGDNFFAAPEGDEIAIAGDGGLTICSLPGLEEIRILHGENFQNAIFEPDTGNVITRNSLGNVQIWVDSEARILIESGVKSMRLSPESRELIVATENGISFVDLATGTESRHHEFDLSIGKIIEIAPDASCIVVGNESKLHALALDGSPLVEFGWGKFNPRSAYASKVDRIAFSPDSQRLATASTEGWVYMWDIATGELIQLIPTGNEPLKDLAFSANGQEVVVCRAEFGPGEYDHNGYAEIWPCPDLEHLIELARKRVFREITSDELAQYGLSSYAGTRSTASLFHLKR